MKFHQNSSSGNRADTCGQTNRRASDGHDERA